MRKTADLLVCLALCGLPSLVLAQEPESADHPASEAQPTAAQRETPSERDPDWFEKLLARELGPLPILDFGSSDGYFRARVPARLLSEPQLIDGNHFVQLDAGMGAAEPVECWIFHDDQDLAASLTGLADATFDHIGQNFGEIEVRAVHRVHGGSVGPHPYMGLDWVYRVAGEKGALAGQVKHLMATRNGRAVYCQNTSVGFVETFTRVFEALVDSIEYDQPLQAPHYVETYVLRIRDQQVGVGQMAHFVDEDGDIKAVDVLSMLIPLDQQTLQASDSVTVEYSRTDGSVISKVDVESDGGEIVNNLRLDPAAEDGWVVNGVFQGKPLEATIDAAPLRSDAGQRHDMQRFLSKAKKGDSMTFPAWSDDFDPSRVTDIIVTYVGPHERGSEVTMETGPINIGGIIDGDASPVELSFNMGPIELTMIRRHVEGKIIPRTDTGQ